MTVPNLHGQLISIKELAEFLQVPVTTIHRWRSIGEAPRAIRVGKHLRFEASDVLEWLQRRKS